MAVYKVRPEMPPKIRVALLTKDSYLGHDLDSVLYRLHIDTSALSSRFVLDEDKPDFIIAADNCLIYPQYCKRLKHYLHSNKEAILILCTFECIDPDLNVFDYAIVWNSDLRCGDRITRNIPYIYDLRANDTFRNELTHEQAREILSSSPKFCNFMYSRSSEQRDEFFRLLSQYKAVESPGRFMSNTFIPSALNASDWYSLSISLNRGCKFSIAMEDASYKGYTTEKIISSLQAHTVPVYWGDPAAADYINPKAFVNCHDYSSFDDVIERVKEIDNDDDLWLDMVTQPWQTQEQYGRTLEIVDEYGRFMRNIFSQDVKTARRRPIGYWGDYCRKNFTGYVASMPNAFGELYRKFRLFIAGRMSETLRLKIKKLFHMD